jgi:hypothetical protein
MRRTCSVLLAVVLAVVTNAVVSAPPLSPQASATAVVEHTTTERGGWESVPIIQSLGTMPMHYKHMPQVWLDIFDKDGANLTVWHEPNARMTTEACSKLFEVRWQLRPPVTVRRYDTLVATLNVQTHMLIPDDFVKGQQPTICTVQLPRCTVNGVNTIYTVDTVIYDGALIVTGELNNTVKSPTGYIAAPKSGLVQQTQLDGSAGIIQRFNHWIDSIHSYEGVGEYLAVDAGTVTASET